MTHSALEMINNLIAEYNNPRNDGYVKEGLKDELRIIQLTIEDALDDVIFEDEDFDPGCENRNKSTKGVVVE